MEYVNFNLAMPVNMYLQLDMKAKREKITKNEIILRAILTGLSNNSEDFEAIKNARFEPPYN